MNLFLYSFEITITNTKCLNESIYHKFIIITIFFWNQKFNTTDLIRIFVVVLTKLLITKSKKLFFKTLYSFKKFFIELNIV
jgi:hypothetical protein